MKNTALNHIRATSLCVLLMGGAAATAQTLHTRVAVDNVALSVRALQSGTDASYSLVPWYSSLDSEVQDFHNGGFSDHEQTTDTFPLDAEVHLGGVATGGEIAGLLGGQTLDTQLDSHCGDWNYARTQSRVLNWVYVSPHTELTLSGHVSESALGYGSDRGTMAILIAQLQWGGNSNIFYRFLNSTGAPQQLDEQFHVTLVNDSDLTVPMTLEFNGYATAGPLGAVPEPGQWAMLAAGLGVLGMRRRSR